MAWREREARSGWTIGGVSGWSVDELGLDGDL